MAHDVSERRELRANQGRAPDPATLHRDASADYAAAHRPEYYVIDGPKDSTVTTCPMHLTGAAFLFEPTEEEVDYDPALPEISFHDQPAESPLDILVEGMTPDSEEMLPLIADDEAMSQQGVLDALSRHNPQEAWQLLYILGPTGEGGGLGYRMVFHDSDAEATALTERIDRLLESERNESLPDGLRHIFRMDRRRLENQREYDLNNWRFDDAAKELHVYTWREGDMLGDLSPWSQDTLTNREGAKALRDLIAQHFNGEETFWQTTGRVAMGTGLVVFGTVDIVAGVSLATGGTAATGGLGAAATVTGGVALTVLGADQIAQGTAMLVSPDPRHHYGPLGALINHLGRSAGGETGAAIADTTYTVAQILVSLGASFRTAQLARARATSVIADGSVVRTLPNAPSSMNWRRFFVEDYPVNLAGDTATLTPSVAGRGMVLEFSEGGSVLIRNAEAADETRRVLLRLRVLDEISNFARRAARRTQMMHGRRMTNYQYDQILAQARGYGAGINRASDARFEALIRAGGGDPEGVAAAFNNVTGELILRRNATFYEGFHEVQHARQWSELGREAYQAQNRFQREFYVFERIMENASQFNEIQRGHAGAYILRLAYDTGFDAFRLPAGYTRDLFDSYYRFRRAAPRPGLSSFVDRMLAASRAAEP